MELVRKRLVIILYILLISCEDNHSEVVDIYGFEFNSTRIEKDLPLLNSDWKGEYNSVNSEIVFQNMEKPREYPLYLLKRIKIQDDKISSEVNLFEGGKTYKIGDNTLREIIYWGYSFNTNTHTFRLMDEKYPYGEYVSREVADSIIQNWGLEKYWQE